MTVTLDDRESLTFAQNDPAGFVAQYPEGLLVIDEIQRAPDLMLALKAAVDRDRRPGRFLVTGSANLLELASTHESMAGRAETIDLQSFSQSELAGSSRSFVDAAFAGTLFPGYEASSVRRDYLERACRGGYPEAVASSVSSGGARIRPRSSTTGTIEA